MQAADALLVPSRAEGWGCVATEALACATPVVATRVGGLPEAVGPGGQLVDPADDGYSSRFAAAIEDVLADPPPAQVLTPALMAQVFGIQGFYADTPDGPVFQPLRIIRA